MFWVCAMLLLASLFAVWNGLIFSYIIHSSSATQEYKDRLDRLLVGVPCVVL